MTYRLAGAAVLPGFDREFLWQIESSLHAALPDTGFVQVLGLGRSFGTKAGSTSLEAPVRPLLADCGLAALLLPALSQAALGPKPYSDADAASSAAGRAFASLASLAIDGSVAYRDVGQGDDPEGPVRALAEAAKPWPVLPGPLPMNAASDPSLPIVLVGPMASGKTTLGSLLAGRAGAEFLDLDALVEARAGLSVSRIFEAEGEAGFRLRESEALEEALYKAFDKAFDKARARAGRPRAVIATGGGAVLAERNRALLASKARVVWLHAGASVLAARAGADEASRGAAGTGRTDEKPCAREAAPCRGSGMAPRRPLLSVANPLARLSALQAERLPFYASVASFLLPVEDGKADVLVEVLHDALF